MTADAGTPVGIPVLQRVPADRVKDFMRACREQSRARAVAQSDLTRAREVARRELEAALAEKKDLAARLERQAEDLAQLQAQKFEAKRDAILAHAALSQARVIAEDYAAQGGWLTDTIMAGVSAILGQVPPADRWRGLVQSCLERTSERWKLSILCHPDDFDALDALVAEGEFDGAIATVLREGTVTPGTCYLKGNSDFFEIDLRAQIEALRAEIAQAVRPQAPPAEEVGA